MDPFHEFQQNITRRHFFGLGSHAVGWAALSSLLGTNQAAGGGPEGAGTPLQTHHAAKAKQVIYQQQPDLVVLDMMMPRMGGYPVLEHFRDKTDAPPIIMITANEGSRHKAYAEYLGVVDYIRKPFAMERLLEAVERGLSGGAKDEAKE